MPWTKEQQSIIDSRDSSILVSAAAGSGKTAVLVERILTKLLDKENPVNIDEFLVVTFTHAAADQMKEKIAGKIEAELQKDPTNSHMIKQLHLVNRADISTIDGFCLKLLKEHLAELSLDASFNIGDKGMIELVKGEVIEELFDKKYSLTNDEEDKKYFIRLLDLFCSDADDEALKDIILSIYNTAESFPVPSIWINNAKTAVSVDHTAEFMNIPWVMPIFKESMFRLKEAYGMAQEGLLCLGEPVGNDKYYKVSVSDNEILEELANVSDYDTLSKKLKTLALGDLRGARNYGHDEDLLNRFKELRKTYKKVIEKCQGCIKDKEIILAEVRAQGTYILPLLNLVEEFTSLYEERLHKQKMLTFSMVAHYVHGLVCGGYDENGKAYPTELGKEISKRYKEIYIDEYQDSNYLQEEILYCISTYFEGKYNMFMVGDVKQSIYKFRMARPDIFLDKYDRFDVSGDEIKIDLKNNFRSRKEVLLPANYFFYQLMGEELGGINYDDGVALVPSREFPPCDSEEQYQTEIHFIDSSNDEDEDTELTEDEINLENVSLEAHFIATRIKELVSKDKGIDVYDDKIKGYRRATYKDIVILSRNISGFGENVYNVLTEKGIPVYLEEPKGYFDAVEIKLIMSMLYVCDNSRQDIPLAAVLLSPMGRLSEDDLAKVVCHAAENNLNVYYLYDKCLCYIEDKEDEIRGKLERIIGIINQLKSLKLSVSISQLINEMLALTNYYEYAYAMPMGDRRKANIDTLIDKAEKFENGYYKGLFNFIRYVEKLKVNDVDFGEANVASEEENVTRIISMHKSKGLEYPIVFVSGLGKNFNKQDTRAKLIIHSDYYLSGYIYNQEKRYKKNSIAREAITTLINKELIGEEYRILYVALTRAEEKLILTGCAKGVARLRDKLSEELAHYDDVLLPYSRRCDSSNFLTPVLAAMQRYDKLNSKLSTGTITMEILDRPTVLADSAVSSVAEAVAYNDVKNNMQMHIDADVYAAYKNSFHEVYRYRDYIDIKGKMSISEIKKLKAFDGNEYDVSDYVEYGVDKKEGGISGASRGTIIHKFMELLDFEEYGNATDKLAYIRESCDMCVERGIFSVDEIKVIYPDKIATFMKSELGKRMIDAAKKNNLYKEKQFQAGVRPDVIYQIGDLPKTEDLVIVQGIIDAYFVEDGDIVLMDYKTDRADKQKLLDLYKAQLEYYAIFLEQMTGMTVKDKIIYSFYLDGEVRL